MIEYCLLMVLESLPCYMILPETNDPNPNHIQVNTMIIDRCEWAPVRYGKGSLVASAETARDLIMENAIHMIEENGSRIIQTEKEEDIKICEV